MPGSKLTFLLRLKFSGWYQVSRREVERRGGVGLLSHYPSLGVALQTIYPEYAWDLSSFKGVGGVTGKKGHSQQLPPKGFWQDKKNMFDALDHAGMRLGIKQV